MQINILEIKGNALDDGPGIRSVIFVKGCPLSCVWCHNPESKIARPEIAYDERVCIKCNDCIETCQQKALSTKNPFFVDRNICKTCFDCVDTCPTGALSRVGTFMDTEDIVLEIEKDLPFFETSNGGVTFSGGEPTLYMDSLSELIQRFRSKGIHTLVETCGYFQWDSFKEKIVPFVDMIYFDIKLMDSKAHLQYCGKDNTLILNNFATLIREIRKTQIVLLPRVPLIPNITATPKNLNAIAAFLQKHHVRHVHLMEYNPLWIEKNAKMGLVNSFTTRKEMNQWMPTSAMDHFYDIFLDYSIFKVSSENRS
jgi:pyruvate formate lyase activating enzyme